MRVTRCSAVTSPAVAAVANRLATGIAQTHKAAFAPGKTYRASSVIRVEDNADLIRAVATAAANALEGSCAAPIRALSFAKDGVPHIGVSVGPVGLAYPEHELLDPKKGDVRVRSLLSFCACSIACEGYGDRTLLTSVTVRALHLLE